MDKAQRGVLLVEQEEATADVRKLSDELKHMGAVLAELARILTSSPQDTTFSNAPGDLGSMPAHLLHRPGLNWHSIPEKTDIAQRVQTLRKRINDLENIQSQLRG